MTIIAFGNKGQSNRRFMVCQYGHIDAQKIFQVRKNRGTYGLDRLNEKA
jgi:hypothetical protein